MTMEDLLSLMALQEQLKKQLEDQKAQAELLKVSQSKLPNLPPVFELLGVKGNTDEMPRISFADLKEEHFAGPFVVTEFMPSQAFVQWQSDKASQTYISKWAGLYKKNQLFVTHHKLAQPIEDAAICAMTDVAFSHSFKAIKDKVDF